MFTLATYTTVHVLISLLGIVFGAIVVGGLLESKRLTQPTRVFLIATTFTSLTGFGFPFDHLLPSHVVGALSLAVLAIAIFARYGRGLARGWRAVYVVTAMLAYYFNVFVLVAQLFQKVPVLKRLAPTQLEPPFLLAQAGVLVVFVVLTIMTIVSFHPERKRSTAVV